MAGVAGRGQETYNERWFNDLRDSAGCSEVIHTVMHKLFRWFFGPSVRPATPQDVLDAMRNLVARVEATDERVERMDGQLRRMRGYVYAKKGNLLDTFGDEAPQGRKAFLEAEARKRRLTKPELRELAGLAPLGSSRPVEGSNHE